MSRGSYIRNGIAVVALVLCGIPGSARAQLRPIVPPGVPQQLPIPGSTPSPGVETSGWLQRATAAIAHGRIDEATKLLGEVSDSDPDGRTVRARLALREGRVDDALALLTPAAAQDSTGEAALELGLLQWARGREEEAMALLARIAAAAAGPSDVAAITRVARAKAALGEFRQANQLFRRAARAGGGDAMVETAWGELFLEKHNAQDAARSFGEALKADADWAPAHLGLARALADINAAAAARSLSRALELDPGLSEAHVLRARLELDAGRDARAREALQNALSINPASVPARALVAAIARVEDRTDEFESAARELLAENPRYAGAHDTASDLLSRAYRFDEAVALGRRAVEIDPSSAPVLARLGLNLMRTGDEAEARRALDAAFRIDPYDIVTHNLLALLDTLDEFETVADGPFTFRFHKDEAAVMKEYAPRLARDAFEAFASRYSFTPRAPILIEIFPRHDDFAVRTLGLPGLVGALGACFGRVVTMDSPKARRPNTFSWQATLWHELAHVVALQLSNQRVPRWLTEGMSVYEERRARPEWGRETDVTFARAWRDGKLPKIRDLNAGFTSPETIALAYYQSSLVVDHLVERRGEPGLVALLTAFGEGLDEEGALQRAFGLSFDSLQASFDAMLRARYESVARALRDVPELKEASTIEAVQALADRHADSFAVQMALGAALAGAGDRAKAAVHYERAAALVPLAAGPEGPRAQLAALAVADGDDARAVQQLTAVLAIEPADVRSARELLEIADRAGDAAAARMAADRVVGLDPFDSTAHAALGRAALADGRHDVAIREFRTAIAIGPEDLATAHCELGEALFAAGQHDDAKRQALASLEVAPLYERAQDLLLKAVEARR